MKRYITIAAAVMTLCGSAIAQSKVGAEVDIERLEYHADSVKVDLRFSLADIKMSPNESVVFTPKLTKGEMNEELPTLVVRRRGGARAYERATKLDNKLSMAAYEEWYGEPYDILEHYGREREDMASYSITLPYERWMVDSELSVDTSTCGCCSEEDGGAITPAGNALTIDIPVVADYTPTPQVELIKPEKVAIKRRDVQYSAALIFRVNSTYIDSNMDRNRAELASIDRMMESIISDGDYTITRVNIIGFASPEGRLSTNMKLSKSRAMALESLMKRKYRTIKPELYNVEFGGENWDKLYEIVAESDLAEREDLLNLIANTTIEEGRETKLMQMNGGSTYKYLLRHYFPATRLVVVDVEYNVDAYDTDRIAEVIETKPENLSLEEMYRLSERYNTEDAEFVEVFMTAVKVFPDDEVAQNNALATEIRQGNLEAVTEVAASVDHETQSAELANSLGVYYMLTGNYAASKKMLRRAIDMGCERAEYNISQLISKTDNIHQQEEIEAFRVKIYGEE